MERLELDLKLLASRLIEARLTAGMSQYKASKLSGVTNSNISRYEHGRVGFSLLTAYRLACTYNVSVDWLLGRTDDQNLSEWIEVEPSDDFENCWRENLRGLATLAESLKT